MKYKDRINEIVLEGSLIVSVKYSVTSKLIILEDFNFCETLIVIYNV